jgi:hypothetical protein
MFKARFLESVSVSANTVVSSRLCHPLIGRARGSVGTPHAVEGLFDQVEQRDSLLAENEGEHAWFGAACPLV